MAFERHQFGRFTQWLKSISQTPRIELRCNAENFLLEERLAGEREDIYEEHLEYPLDEETWSECHENYVEENIYVKSGSPETFEDVNGNNILYTVENDQYLVRLEDISRVDYYQEKTPDEMITHFCDFLSNPEKSENIDIIKNFFYKWNKARDRRPIFAGFWGDFEDIFRDENSGTNGEEDWANRLRDRLGLGHLDLLDGAPKPVLLFRYRVKDVLQTTRKSKKNIAIPTVLDSYISPYFCPTPKKGWNQGQALDLSVGDESNYSINCEILHRAIEYKPEFLYKAGWITKPPGKTLEQARKIHLDFLIDDFENKTLLLQGNR